ncbi:MAG: NCS2 family permease, partial [Candidatus Hydrogenedentes bacterium]|nr:NCS2 family permease [Candidatus Hydrogenedentota bacterium]
MNALDRYFGIEASGSTLRREIVGGLTTFATMSYIIFVQPAVLSGAGMSSGYVMLATCLSAAVATLLMGLLARYPIALAAGMGENFLFVYVCSEGERGLGFGWQAGLAIVLV